MATVEPREKGCKARRQDVDHRWGKSVHDYEQKLREANTSAAGQPPQPNVIKASLHKTLSDEAWCNVEVALAAGGPRNDLLHGGINDDPSDANTLQNNLAESSRKFESFL